MRALPASLPMTKDTERSGVLAREAVWQRGGGGLCSAAEGRPRAPWSSGRDRRGGWADGLPGLGRNGPKGVSVALTWMREMTAHAHRHWPTNKSTSLRLRCGRTGAVCGGLVPTLSAPAAGTAASWMPGRLFRPGTSTDRSVAVAEAKAITRTARKWSGGKAWRNSGQVESSRRLTMEEQAQTLPGQLVCTGGVWDWADPQLRCIRRQDARAGTGPDSGR